jgi:hypothetical protein
MSRSNILLWTAMRHIVTKRVCLLQSFSFSRTTTVCLCYLFTVSYVRSRGRGSCSTLRRTLTFADAVRARPSGPGALARGACSPGS